MQKEELDSLVVEYQKDKDQSVFENIYREVSVRWRKTIDYDVRYASSDHHEMQAMYEDKLLKLVVSYKQSEGHFENLLASSISKGKCDLLRKRSRRRRLEYYPRTEEEAATFLEFEDENANKGFISSDKTKEQRQLLSHLVANADDLTIKLCERYADHETFHSAGKRFGIQGKRVKDRIESLARRFDGNRFGDYHDYLYA